MNASTLIKRKIKKDFLLDGTLINDHHVCSNFLLIEIKKHGVLNFIQQFNEETGGLSKFMLEKKTIKINGLHFKI